MVIIDDAQGSKVYDNYNLKTYVCFTQIFLSSFTCFWTLSASFFISLRMYDMMIKKNRIFNNKIMDKYVCLISIFIPALLSYSLWTKQVIDQSNRFNSITNDEFYQKKHAHSHFRHLYCWFDTKLNIVIFIIAFLFIAANFYFSVIKGFFFVHKISGQLKERAKNERESLRRTYDKMNHIKKTLWLYPFTSAVIWISFFVIQINMIINKGQNSLLSLFGCLLISVRQIIYVLIFLVTQRNIYRKLLECILCKSKRRKKIAIISDKSLNI